MRRVYRFGLLAPVAGERMVREQLRAAHEYRNNLVAIERGRRYALRLLDDTDDVREAIEVVQAATMSTRKAAVAALRAARKSARRAMADELARIDELDTTIRRDARALTRCYWGSYLAIEAAHQQARRAPLYGGDAVTPNDPSFARGPRLGREAFSATDPRHVWWLGEGQIGVQLQKGLATCDALRGIDSRVRLQLRTPKANGARFGELSLRVGSDGRDPVWARWPILCHRAVPDAVIWKWVRVSLRLEGRREVWSVEITVDDPAPDARSLDASLSGAIAVEWEWSAIDDGAIRIARWADTRGASGQVLLPTRIADGIRKPDGLRAVRDLVLNERRLTITRLIKDSRDPKPRWLTEAANVMHLWRSPDRFRAILYRWRAERCDAARPAYEALDSWLLGTDDHLREYEAGARGEALRERRDLYRCIAARWSREYRYALISDQDLSREARVGPDAGRRQTAGVYQLRDALRNRFRDDAINSRWRDNPEEEEDREWCERTRDAWIAGGARGDGRFAELKPKTANTWAQRKAAKAAKFSASAGARESVSKVAE